MFFTSSSIATPLTIDMGFQKESCSVGSRGAKPQLYLRSGTQCPQLSSLAYAKKIYDKNKGLNIPETTIYTLILHTSAK